MFDFIWTLPLAALFLLALALTLTLAAIIVATVRLAVRLSGFNSREALPLKDALISVSSAMLALTLAFSAAGVWTDTLQARSAVQREANALEHALSLSLSLEEQQGDTVRASIVNYASVVIERDWPAMAHAADLDDPVYQNSDRVLVHLIDYLAGEAKKAPHRRPWRC